MDKMTKKMGFPVGSATLMDKVGIDVAAKISEYLGKELGTRLGDSTAMVSILKEMVSKGMLGKCVLELSSCRFQLVIREKNLFFEVH